MVFSAKNGKINGTEYIRFGTGQRVLIILPGLGDGLKTVGGTAVPMAVMYRMFSKDFTVYMFSRREDLPMGHSTRDMAKDLADSMDALGIEKADVLGVSMGGMIAQWLAIDYPERVGKLILTVTAARPNGVLEESIKEWMAQAKSGDHSALMDSNLKRIYSERYYRQNKWMIPLLGVLTKPKSYERFLILAEACLNHDAYTELSNMKAPTFVIGGGKDMAIGPDAAGELAKHIPGAVLKVYPQWGHGLYEEAKDFNATVLKFLQ